MSDEQNTVWLSAEQQRIWRTYLSAVARINDHLNEALRSFHLDLNEYEILVALSEAPDHAVRMSELASTVHQSRSRLTHTAARMEKQGLLERCRANKDRRGVLAQLTDRGMELLVEAAPTHVRSVREALVDVMDPQDYRALGRAMAAVLAVRD
ncbi:DNA-binding transcriptional regulator, MarR family [Propionibacterium cyclohexanicum]|uniref:DNA-binding transcriptional regulator, MarR family n=1 Tax=Propionibacterium cyclohexanicum TaxID=64702 RepID=A0A1H9SES9_9ACTN|nr:MarR family transcriptional regulator [Propionibacterium cyclohexanicum]SER82699.1 DNA-binding transcriptional regulator, MarR family [Propionibacterium cyclohexanicum]